MKIVLLGAPGAGKGTQSKLISTKYNIPHISTGEILRAEIKSNSALGKLANSLISKGNLVPDDVIVEIVEKRIKQPDCLNGFILDGFPRTLFQAKKLDEITELDYIIELSVDEKSLVKRLCSRLTCKNCGSVFTKSDNFVVCPVCGGNLYKRDDDTKEVIKQRFINYNNQTKPVRDYYLKDNRLIVVKENTIENNFEEIQNILNK